MADPFDDAFHDRVAAHINMSNEQNKAPGLSANAVNHSMLFASARFSAWLSATMAWSRGSVRLRRDGSGG